MSERHLGRLDVYPNAGALAAGLADLFCNVAETAQTERGAFYVALAGGTTPTAAYKLLASDAYSERISWGDVYVYFGDERCVRPDDPLSNYKNAYDALLSHVPIPAGNVHRMQGEIDPAQAATAYAQILREDLGEYLRFDLLMLGLGKDGHTASLFPGTDPLTDNDRLVRATYSKATQTNRISITPKVINSARVIAIATEGPDKAAALGIARQGPYDPTACPAQIVDPPASSDFIWLVDELAAGMLTKR
ncbi:MAG TPA: 6-phosphogluconolactonase [Candidatus Baltobacteraceae bacterium]|jgi:6-phosphogluconolactonase